MWQQQLQDWVSLLKQLANAGHLDALRLLPDVLRAAGRPTSPGDVGLLKQLGDCFLQAQQWPEALVAYKAALAELTSQQQQEQQQEQEQEHTQHLQAQDHQQPLTTSVCLQACCAAALYPQGGPHTEAALHLLHDVLANPQGRSLPAALRLCGQAAADQQRWPAAATAALRLLAQLPSDKEGARVLSQAAQEPGGMQALLAAVLHDGGSAAAADRSGAVTAETVAVVIAPGAPAALCFLAHTLLTQGAVQPAVQLYRQAVQLNPACSTCALGLAQALEVQCDCAGVLRAVLGFCSSQNLQQQLGPLLLQTLTKEVPALQQLSQEPFYLGSLQWYQQQQQQQQQEQQEQQQHSASSSTQCSGQGAEVKQPADRQQQAVPGSQTEEQHSELTDHQQLCCSSLQALHIMCSQAQQYAAVTVSPAATGQLARTPAAATAGAAGVSQPSGANQQAVDLPALALLITAAKLLFCGGALLTASQLLQLLLPAEQAAAAVQPLHHSSIRNEAAYAALLRKLLSEAPAAAWSAPGPGVKTDVVYVCGDSHILPIAWRTVTLGGQDHLLVPLLITGCKVWHLRPGSTPPCARQLEAALAAVPAGSKVLMVLGEIDCREGLLTAVAKGKYRCLEDAVAATVGVYVTALLQLIQSHALQRLWVHCVPPVLQETRHVVQLFNSALKQQLGLQLRDEQPAQVQQGASSSVHLQHVRYLDLEAQLLSSRQWLCFDGTHLHPGYVQELLQAAMTCRNSQ